MEKAKVLQKDLPFGNLKKGTVITLQDSTFTINHGTIWHGGDIFLGAHNGITMFNDSYVSLLKEIWDNENWFMPVKLSKIKYKRTNQSITLYFDSPLDLSDVETLAKGIKRTLEKHYKETVTGMGWRDELVDVIF